jgi:hypothetical protein
MFSLMFFSCFLVETMDSFLLSDAIELEQDLHVTDDVYGTTCTFSKGEMLPAVAELGAGDHVMFLGGDFEHVVVQVPQVIRHKASILACELSNFLVVKEGVTQLEETLVFPKEIKMPCGQTYMMLNLNKIIAFKSARKLSDQFSLQAASGASSSTAPSATHSKTSYLDLDSLRTSSSAASVSTSLAFASSQTPLSDLESQRPSALQVTAEEIAEVILPPSAASILAADVISENSVVPDVPIDEPSASLYSVLIKPRAILGPKNWLIPQWLQRFEENYDQVFVPTLSPKIQHCLAKNEKFEFSRWNCSLLDDLLGLVFKLSGNHRPSPRECDHLASILARKHPRNYGSVEVSVVDGRESTLAGERNAGGLNGNANLGNRLDKRFYEVFLRKKNALSRAKAHSTEEPPIKQKKGRPKVIPGMDSHKMYPNLTEQEKLEKTASLKAAEDLDPEARTEVYKYEGSGSVIQHTIISSSVSSAVELAPAFFQSSIHLQKLFFDVSQNNDIFKKSRENLKFEMRVLEEFLLDELPSGNKTDLIESMLRKDSNPANHAFFLLRSLADIWDQKIDKLIFVAEKDNECLKECPEPHLVASLGDLRSLSLYVDHTKILDCLDVPTGLAALIAIHFLANLEYGKDCRLLKEYLQREVLDLGDKFIAPRGQKMQLRKLNLFQTRKRDIVKKMHCATVINRRLI